MAEAPVFVHLFRNKEEFKRQEEKLETLKGKFEAEEEYRKKLVADSGWSENEAVLPVNSNTNPGLLYPEYEHNSKEYLTWRRGYSEESCTATTTQQSAAIHAQLPIPTEVLEESVIVHKNRFFEQTRILNLPSSRLYYGSRGAKRYLIAWWGEKRHFDEIQQTLACLAKESPEDSSSKNLAALLAVASFFLLFFLLALMWDRMIANLRGGETKQEIKESALKQEAEEDRIFDELEKTEKHIWEHHIDWLFIDSAPILLPPGKVVAKEELNCAACRDGKYYAIRIKTSRTSEEKISVSKEVFDAAKEGSWLLPPK